VDARAAKPDRMGANDFFLPESRVQRQNYVETLMNTALARGCVRRGPCGRKFSLLAAFLAALIQLAPGSEPPNLIERPNADAGPTQVSVGMWVVDINSIDSAQQTFTADIVVVLQWKDSRLTHTGGALAHYSLGEIWHPRVAIVNETNSVSRRLPEAAEVDANGSVDYRQRYVGAFTQSLRLESFPFDKQTFRVQLVAIRYNPNEVKFVPDQKWIDAGLKQAGGIAPSITLPDWTVEKWDIKTFVYRLAPGLDNSGYVFEFTASRDVKHYILTVILPLVLIVMMSWAVFWIDPVTSNSQISIAVTSMLTLIAYRFAVDSQLPRLPYTTRLDAFILTSTLLVFFSLIEVVVTTILEKNQRAERAKTIDRYCRPIFPAIFVLTLIAIFVKPYF
jgi:Neurotransmitter-gated ion-channel ligand binding domain/Neurotransmitter-gated ion-channel transmembrane region